MGTFYLYVSLCQTESICFVGVIIILFFLPESKAVASWPADHQYSHVSVYFGELLEVFILTFFHPPKELVKTSLVAQMVKRLPAVQETRVQSLGREDPLEKEMATHSSTLAWKIPWMEELGRLQSMWSQRVGHD